MPFLGVASFHESSWLPAYDLSNRYLPIRAVVTSPRTRIDTDFRSSEEFPEPLENGHWMNPIHRPRSPAFNTPPLHQGNSYHSATTAIPELRIPFPSRPT